MLKSVLAVAACLAALSFAVARSVEGGERRPEQAAASAPAPDYDRELFFAVLEGLYSDALSNETVDALTATDPEHGYPANFVWACPVCMPAYRAFLTYRARPHFDWIKGDQDFGPGLDELTLARLTQGAIETRQQELMKLVERWLARRLAAQRLTPDERAAWKLEMEIRRKKGMALLESYKSNGLKGSYARMKACPFCDGANNPFRPEFLDERRDKR
ncbi:MAG: hypothetical protein IT454_15930 [Planctomycetes bacterium]|nr:hypothetical protein [Planctomycetota bacterium]